MTELYFANIGKVLCDDLTNTGHQVRVDLDEPEEARHSGIRVHSLKNYMSLTSVFQCRFRISQYI